MKNAIKVAVFTVLFIAAGAGVVFGFFKYSKTDFTTSDSSENNTVVIDSYNGSSVNIDIPAKIRGKKVTAIDSNAFEGTKIKSVIIPKGVKRIEQAAFKDCSELESVTVSGNLEYIGENAFGNCDKLTEFTFPESLKTIGASPFGDCDNLKKINTENNGSFVFDNGVLYSTDKSTAYFALESTDLSNYKFPAELKNFSSFFFFNREELKSIELPDGMISVEESLFALCTNLKSVKIPDGVKKIGNSAFLGCISLDKLYIPESVKSFDKFCFPVSVRKNEKNEDSNKLFNDKFTLIVEKNSSAYFYAVENNINYEFAE